MWTHADQGDGKSCLSCFSLSSLLPRRPCRNSAAARSRCLSCSTQRLMTSPLPRASAIRDSNAQTIQDWILQLTKIKKLKLRLSVLLCLFFCSLFVHIILCLSVFKFVWFIFINNLILMKKFYCVSMCQQKWKTLIIDKNRVGLISKTYKISLIDVWVFYFRCLQSYHLEKAVNKTSVKGGHMIHNSPLSWACVLCHAQWLSLTFTMLLKTFCQY